MTPSKEIGLHLALIEMTEITFCDAIWFLKGGEKTEHCVALGLLLKFTKCFFNFIVHLQYNS